MAVAREIVSPPTLTFEDYMAEGEIMARYDIIDGIRMMTNPNRIHQEVALNLAEAFRRFQRASRAGRTIIAPCDILIRRAPLRTRQPDLIFIGNERWTANGDPADPAPLTVAPELVVEILSPSDKPRVRAGKIADYIAVGVRECWMIRPDAETVEVLRLDAAGFVSTGVYGPGESARSVVFPDLDVPVADIFTIL